MELRAGGPPRDRPADQMPNLPHGAAVVPPNLSVLAHAVPALRAAAARVVHGEWGRMQVPALRGACGSGRPSVRLPRQCRSDPADTALRPCVVVAHLPRREHALARRRALCQAAPFRACCCTALRDREHGGRRACDRPKAPRLHAGSFLRPVRRRAAFKDCTRTARGQGRGSGGRRRVWRAGGRLKGRRSWRHGRWQQQRRRRRGVGHRTPAYRSGRSSREHAAG